MDGEILSNDFLKITQNFFEKGDVTQVTLRLVVDHGNDKLIKYGYFKLKQT